MLPVSRAQLVNVYSSYQRISDISPHADNAIVAVGSFPSDSGLMIMKGLSVHGWPSGHALDSEAAISFARLQGVKCMVEKFPLDKVGEATEHMLSGRARFRCVLTME